MPSGVYDRSGKSNNGTPPEQVAAILADWKAGGKTYPQLAAKYKLHYTTIAKIIRRELAKKTEHTATPAMPPAVPATEILDANPNPSVPPHPGAGPKPGGGKYGHLAEQMKALRDQGYSYTEIANKLGMHNQGKAAVAAVSYYLTVRDRRAVKTTIEGASSNGHEQLDTRFLVGFGCAELERTLTAIAQRLGVAPNLLRQGFSKFLGSTAVR